MWPDIKTKNGKGIKFDESFWDNWGPTEMFYFHPDLFDDTKEINSIYCMYLPEFDIKFDPNEIAMGLTYECGDFGQHTVLFSYSKSPNINHKKIWDYCVFPDFSSDNSDLVDLKENLILQKDGKITME